jgi:hypothetical protein
MRGTRLALLIFLLAACAAPASSPSGTAGQPGFAPARVLPPPEPPGLELVSQVFLVVERQYVTVPSFAVLRSGALAALVAKLPPGLIRIEGSMAEPILVSHPPGGAAQTERFSGASRTEVLRDLASAHRMAREIAPSLDARELQYAMLRGALQRLDPPSVFLDPAQYRARQNPTSGGPASVGLEITIREGHLTVAAPIEGAPAERAGLEAGDRIIAIDGQPTQGVILDEAIRTLRGPSGTAVALTVERKGEEAPRTVMITREVVVRETVQVDELEAGLGYTGSGRSWNRPRGTSRRGWRSWSRRLSLRA